MKNPEKNPNQAKILQEFLDAEAILKGHFILSSGLHSDTYIQCARVLMSPRRSEKLCGLLAQKILKQFGENAFDLVLSPAMGGVVVGYEIARQLGVDSIFCERVEGKFVLRRGFAIKPGARILIVEDVITTGKSSLETFEIAKQHGAKIIAEAALVDRSGADATDILKVPVVSLIQVAVKTFSADNIPNELQKIPAIKPGSRFVKP